MEAGPGAETTDSCRAGDRRWPRIASCPREPGGEERFFRTDSRGAQPHVHLDFRHPVPRTVRQYAVLRDGSPRALTRGTLAAPSRALVASGGHGTRPVLPAVVLLPSHFMRGSKVTPLGCARGDPGARLRPAVWADGSSQSRSWSGYSFAHCAPTAQQERGFPRCWGSGLEP